MLEFQSVFVQEQTSTILFSSEVGIKTFFHLIYNRILESLLSGWIFVDQYECKKTIPDKILSKRSYVLMTLEEKRMMIMVLVRSCTNTRWNSKIYALLAL